MQTKDAANIIMCDCGRLAKTQTPPAVYCLRILLSDVYFLARKDRKRKLKI